MGRIVLVLVSVIFFSLRSSGQLAPVLGTTEDFVLFTAAGDFTNTGVTAINGDIGTNAGTYDGGFSTVTQIGTRYNPGTVTATAAADVLTAYDDFNKNACSSTLTGQTLGNGQTMMPGQYCYGDATSLEGTLILDGNADPSSIFIFKFNGAFSPGNFSRIRLINGAAWSNVYWRVTGAFNLGSDSFFAGTVVASGAINLLDRSTLQGRALSTAGAVNLHGNILTLASSPLPVTLTAFTVRKAEVKTVVIEWETTRETNSDYFQLERSIFGKKWEVLAIINAKGESNSLVPYSYTDIKPLQGKSLYRLKMTDRDASFSYSRIRSVEIEGSQAATGFPNPTDDKLTIMVDGVTQIERIQLSNMQGSYVYDQTTQPLANISPVVDMKNFPAGQYIIKITRPGGDVGYLKVVKR